ncbi:MAG: hypothetical protein WA803_03440 [Steroidobacteraceae bacterium]
MTAPGPIEIPKVRNTVGEGILWDWRRLDAQALRDDPNAGDVFFYRTGARGLREPEYVS